MLALLRARLPRIGRSPRLLVAATCLLLALASATSGGHHGSRPAPLHRVVVAAHDMPAGHTLSHRDLKIVGVPGAVPPSGARAGPATVVGARLAGPIDAGEAITRTRLVSAGLAAGLPPTLVAAAVLLDDPRASDLVRVGDRVDILETARPPDLVGAVPAGSTEVGAVAHRALVLAVLPARDDGSAELITAVSRPTAARLTRDRSTEVFTAVVVAP